MTVRQKSKEREFASHSLPGPNKTRRDWFEPAGVSLVLELGLVILMQSKAKNKP